MDKQGTYHIIQRANDTLGFAILWRSIGAGKTQQDATRCEELGGRVIHELSAVVRLNSFKRQTELCANIVRKIDDMHINFGFLFERKSPTEMSEIVENDQII